MGRIVLLALALLLLVAAPASAATSRLAPADRKAIRSVLTQYIPAVLQRQDVRLGYELSGPQVRGSTTLREWLRGGVPVYPFPARGDRIDGWTLNYVEPGDVGLDLLIQPRKGAAPGAIAFKVEMTKIGGRWKVNAFYPEATFDNETGKVFSNQDVGPNGATAQASKPPVDAAWLALPAALLGAAIVLGPLAWFLVNRRRERSAYREYLQRTAG
jgi:hypothetical protein